MKVTLEKNEKVEIIENALTYIVVFAMFTYGLGKIVQFNHAQHVDAKVSVLSGMQLMWAFYGYSYPFVITLGFLEVFGGILMLFKKTRIFGCFFVSTILINVILQDIFYGVNLGALRAAIIYQLCIIVLLWLNRIRLYKVAMIIFNYEKYSQTSIRWWIKIGLSVTLFILLRIFEYYITIKW